MCVHDILIISDHTIMAAEEILDKMYNSVLNLIHMKTKTNKGLRLLFQ